MVTRAMPVVSGSVSTIVIPIVVVLLVIFVGALLYYFCKKKDNKASSRYSKYQSIGSRCIVQDEYDGPSEQDASQEPGGLSCNKETCHLNYLIQAIASNNTLVKEYDELIKRCNKYRECPKLMIFVKILKNINARGGSLSSTAINTDGLKRLIKYADCKLESEQDPFQLLLSLINFIQKDIKDILENENVVIPPKMNILRTFVDNPDVNTIENVVALNLSLCGTCREKSEVPISDLLDSFFTSSKIESSSNESQMFFFERAPEVLILHVNTNKLHVANTIRYHESMRYQFNVQMRRDASEMKRMEVEYRLTAVVHRTGGVSVGSYVTYRQHGGEWFLTKDEQVEKTCFSNDFIPSMLVFEKVSQVPL